MGIDVCNADIVGGSEANASIKPGGRFDEPHPLGSVLGPRQALSKDKINPIKIIIVCIKYLLNAG